MVRKGSTVRVRKGAPGAGSRARSAWRSSSVGKSTRLIIVGSRVRVPPPLPRPTSRPKHPARPGPTRKSTSHGQREVRAQQAALEHWHHRSYRPWEDDVDGGDHQGARRQEPERALHRVRSDRQGAGREGAWYHDLDRARGVRDGEPSLRARRLPGSRRLHQEHDHRCGADGRRDPGRGGDRRSDAADA